MGKGKNDLPYDLGDLEMTWLFWRASAATADLDMQYLKRRRITQGSAVGCRCYLTPFRELEPQPKIRSEIRFLAKWSPICCCQSSTEVVRWIGNMAAANPMVKSVCPKIRHFPFWLISNFWREFAYISARDKDNGFKFGMQHRFDKSYCKISQRGKTGLTVDCRSSQNMI